MKRKEELGNPWIGRMGGASRGSRLGTRRCMIGLLAIACFVTVDRARGEGKEFKLAEGGRSLVTVYAPGESQWAGARLVDRVSKLTGVELRLMTTAAEPAAGEDVVAVGTPDGNPIVRRVLGQDDRIKDLGQEGFVLRVAESGGRRVLVAGGRTLAGVNNAVSELVSWKLKLTEGRASVPEDLNETDRPTLKYRILWAWDSLVNFSDTIEEMHRVQQFPPTLDGPVWFNKNDKEAYMTHFKRAVDFASDHKLNGYIIWGFMRDETGGLETGREISRYAKQQNVRVLPGVCTENAYGGFTFSHRSEYCLDVWTKEHPELRFKHPKASFEPGVCPSKPQNERWLREGTKWFFENLPDVGGMNLENGDWMLCSTEDCVAERAKPENDHNFLWDQMRSYGPVLEEARRLRPDAWITFATYIGMTEPAFKAEMEGAVKRGLGTDFVYPPRMLKQLPDFGIAQWTFSGMLQQPEKLMPEGSRPPAGNIREHIGFMHQGSIWGTRADPDRWWAAPAASLDDASAAVQLLCSKVHQMGMAGVAMKGQVGPASPANELNYLAMEYFTWHPERSWEQFFNDRLTLCYGGEIRAQLFLELLRSIIKYPVEIERQQRQASETASNSDLDVRQRARWRNLADELVRRVRLAKELTQEGG